jgi:type IV pilus assembly protein PilN
MAHINLLPWREELRNERQKTFIINMVIALVFAGLVLGAVILVANSLIDEQNKRNAFLQNEIAQVNKKIKEIEKIEKEKERLLARMEAIQNLQSSRPKVVKVLDAIVRIVPDGVNFNSMTRQGNSISFKGKAESNSRVSVLMNQIDANSELDEANLQIISKAGSAQDRVKTFSLQVNESKPKNNGENE